MWYSNYSLDFQRFQNLYEKEKNVWTLYVIEVIFQGLYNQNATYGPNAGNEGREEN